MLRHLTASDLPPPPPDPFDELLNDDGLLLNQLLRSEPRIEAPAAFPGGPLMPAADDADQAWAAPASAEDWLDEFIGDSSDAAATLPLDGLPAPATLPSAEQDCTLSGNQPDCCDTVCPSLAHSARSDGAAVSAAPLACFTPESVRYSSDPRDCIQVGCEPLVGDEVKALIAAHEKQQQNSSFWTGETLFSTRGVLDESMAAARARLEAVSAVAHQRWPSVQSLVLVLRIGAINLQEAAGVVHVGGLSQADSTAALCFAKGELHALLG